VERPGQRPFAVAFGLARGRAKGAFSCVSASTPKPLASEVTFPTGRLSIAAVPKATLSGLDAWQCCLWQHLSCVSASTTASRPRLCRASTTLRRRNRKAAHPSRSRKAAIRRASTLRGCAPYFKVLRRKKLRFFLTLLRLPLSVWWLNVYFCNVIVWSFNYAVFNCLRFVCCFSLHYLV